MSKFFEKFNEEAIKSNFSSKKKYFKAINLLIIISLIYFLLISFKNHLYYDIKIIFSDLSNLNKYIFSKDIFLVMIWMANFISTLVLPFYYTKLMLDSICNKETKIFKLISFNILLVLLIGFLNSEFLGKEIFLNIKLEKILLSIYLIFSIILSNYYFKEHAKKLNIFYLLLFPVIIGDVNINYYSDYLLYYIISFFILFPFVIGIYKSNSKFIKFTIIFLIGILFYAFSNYSFSFI